MSPKTYPISVENLRANRQLQKSFDPYLEPHHTHFLLVDNGTKGKFRTEIEFRALLEAEIAAYIQSSVPLLYEYICKITSQ